MAKGNGSDFENQEDEENINEEYCELGEEFIEAVIEGDEGNFEETEDADEEYRPLSKRGRISSNFR